MAEGDRVIADGKILQRAATGSNRTGVDVPVFGKRVRRKLAVKACVFDHGAEASLHEFGEYAYQDKEGPGTAVPPVGLAGEGACGHDVVNVRMVLQCPSPGMEHAEEARNVPWKPNDRLSCFRVKRRLGACQDSNILADHGLSEVILEARQLQVDLLRRITESKEQLGRRIVEASAPLTASAFLADIGDVRRFPSLRRMNAYLGLLPRCHDSGSRSRPGHITRESRKLSRTILTQSIYQTIKATPGWERH